MKSLSAALFLLAVSQTSLAAESSNMPARIDKPGVPLQAREHAVVQVKPENRTRLCSPNLTQSCTTNRVTKGAELCKQDECTCVNPDGKSTYKAVDTELYDCIPANDGVKAPAKVLGY
jgi:hypothetical protein